MKVSELLSKYDGNIQIEVSVCDVNAEIYDPEIYLIYDKIPDRIAEATIESWSITDATLKATFKLCIAIC